MTITHARLSTVNPVVRTEMGQAKLKPKLQLLSAARNCYCKRNHLALRRLLAFDSNRRICK